MQHAFWIRNTSEMTAHHAVELARAADEGGWDAVFVSDAVAEDHTEPFTLLAAMAAVTDRVGLGTWVTPLPARDAVAVARSAAMVDHLSRGRLTLGVGVGNEVEHRALGVAARGGELGRRYDATLDVVSSLLEGHAVTRHDEWFDLEDVSLNLRGAQTPRPPILCAASWPNRAPVRRAARWDGLMPQWPGLGEGRDPEVAEGARVAELREIVHHYREHGGAGRIVVPAVARFGQGYVDECRELGVTGLLWADDSSPADLRRGPTRHTDSS